MQKNSVLFILNPISGTRKKTSFVKLIQDYYANTAYSVEIKFTRDSEDAAKLAKKAVEKGIEIVVAAGGDGTVNQIARELCNTNTTLGILPLGSGNGLARHLNISMNIEKALDTIKNGESIQVDYGKINKEYFFCTCGVGFDARIGNVFATQGSRGLGTYIRTTLDEFRKYKPTKYKLKIGDNKFSIRAFLITFANASQYGNNAYIAPNASMMDGILDVTIIKPFPTFAAPDIGIKLFKKRVHYSPFVEVFSARKVVLKRKKKGEVHIDGEPWTMGKKLSISIVEKGLKVRIPKGASV